MHARGRSCLPFNTLHPSHTVWRYALHDPAHVTGPHTLPATRPRPARRWRSRACKRKWTPRIAHCAPPRPGPTTSPLYSANATRASRSCAGRETLQPARDLPHAIRCSLHAIPHTRGPARDTAHARPRTRSRTRKAPHTTLPPLPPLPPLPLAHPRRLPHQHRSTRPPRAAARGLATGFLSQLLSGSARSSARCVPPSPSHACSSPHARVVLTQRGPLGRDGGCQGGGVARGEGGEEERSRIEAEPRGASGGRGGGAD